MAKNWKPKLNSFNFHRQSKELKEVFRKLNLNVDDFDKSVLTDLCKAKLGNKISLSQIKREDVKQRDMINIPDVSGEYDSVNGIIERFQSNLLAALKNNNIDVDSIDDISAETSYDEENTGNLGVSLYFTQKTSEDDDSFNKRVELAKQRNILIARYDDILALALSQHENKISRRKEITEINDEIKKLNKRKKELEKYS